MRAVNLIPAEQRSSGMSFASLAGRSGGAAYLVVGVVCGLALIALLYGLAAHEINSKQGESERLSAEAAQAQAQAAKLAPYTRFVAMREERLKAVQQLANTRFDWAHSMHELGRVLPSDVALSSVTATVGSTAAGSSSAAASSSASSASASGAAGAGAGGSVSSVTPAGSTPTFTIAGCTTSQSEVALTMDRLRLIDGVSEVSLQSSAKGSSSGGSGGGSNGGCPSGDPTFTLQVTFAALPQPAVKTPPIGTSPAADTSSANSGSGKSGTEGQGR